MALPRFWSHLSTTDFAALDPQRAVAVLPLGATEQHGPHLPLDVDRALVDGIVAAALPLLPAASQALILPTQAIGYSAEHTNFPGTLSLSPSTVIATWLSLGEGVARAGLKKLLLFNSHGGNVALMDVVARELRMAQGLMVWRCSWFDLPLGDQALGQFDAHEHRFGIHGGDIETSMMLALHPGLVRMERARDFASASAKRAEQFPILGNGRSARLGWAVEDYNAQGAVGNAARATAAKGRVMVEAAARQLALLLEEIAGLPLQAPVEPPARETP